MESRDRQREFELRDMKAAMDNLGRQLGNIKAAIEHVQTQAPLATFAMNDFGRQLGALKTAIERLEAQAPNGANINQLEMIQTSMETIEKRMLQLEEQQRSLHKALNTINTSTGARQIFAQTPTKWVAFEPHHTASILTRF